jgi:hypothetical protein
MSWSMLSVTLSAPGKEHQSFAQRGHAIQLDRAYDCLAHHACMFAFSYCDRRPSGPVTLAGGRL